ncbi:MAG: hypothetical protein SAJ12_13565 [Jaaginema sp. PMC 1079.18]|nr:hypothetical protein [Jaaginema sp. PMC 1080.18]MEC4852011.1 hypothetical protein [Jaaginema sp. PMC 1079.18]MEC4866808.1 hypothetical protein [Jaaginema sp. PMC 1078.18]
MNEDQDTNRHIANREFKEALEQLKSLSQSSEAETRETDIPVDADDPLWEDALADIERYLQEKGQEED